MAPLLFAIAISWTTHVISSFEKPCMTSNANATQCSVQHTSADKWQYFEGVCYYCSDSTSDYLCNSQTQGGNECTCTDCANITEPTIAPTTAPSATMNGTTTTGIDKKLGITVPTTAEFTTQLYISIPVCIGLIALYCTVRKWKALTWELRRKLSQNLLTGSEDSADEQDFDMEKIKFDVSTVPKCITFPNLSSNPIAWMYDVWTMDTNTFFMHAGFDALVFKLYLQGCAYICLASLPYALLVLLPVYGTSVEGKKLGWLDVISMNTIGKDDSNRLYAAVVGSYIFSFIALYYLSKVYLAVACATDQFLIGAKQLKDIENISWFNYKKAIDGVIDFNLNLAKKPINIVGDIYSVGNKLINKQRISVLSSNISSESNKQTFTSGTIEMDALEEHKIMDFIDEIELSEEEKQAMIPEIDRYTVMIRNLPRQFRNGNNLKQFMEQLFPHKIAHVVVVPDVSILLSVQKQIRYHQKKLRKLAKKHDFNIWDLYDDTKMPQIFEGTKCCGYYGEEVNLVQYHRSNKDALIAKFRKKKKDLTPTPTAFVIFNSLTEAANCVSTPIRFGLKTLKVSKAPYPKDLYWTNLKFKEDDLIVNNVLVTIAKFFLLFFWSIPVVGIQALANLDKVFETFGGNVNTILSEETAATLQGVLTVLVLDIWLGILPIICEILTFIQRKRYRGRHEMLVLTKYFDCLVVMVLLVTVVSGTIISGGKNWTDYVENMVGSLSSIVDALANGLSRMSTYFLLYVLLNAFLWLPVELFRPAYFMYRRFHIPEANRFRYSVWYAKTMLILAILLTYCVMNPIMWLFGLVYFVFATFVFTYNLSMSWVPAFETGAKQWPMVFGRIRFAFMIAIFTLFGLMTLKKAYICSALLLPLAGFIWFFTTNINVKFRTVFRVTSLTSARRKDEQITKFVNGGIVNTAAHLESQNALKYVYLPPIMSVNYKKNKAKYSPPKLQTL